MAMKIYIGSRSDHSVALSLTHSVTPYVFCKGGIEGYNNYNDYRDSDLDLDLDWERFSELVT